MKKMTRRPDATERGGDARAGEPRMLAPTCETSASMTGEGGARACWRHGAGPLLGLVRERVRERERECGPSQAGREAERGKGLLFSLLSPIPFNILYPHSYIYIL